MTDEAQEEFFDILDAAEEQVAGPGHNSDKSEEESNDVGGIAAKKLQSYVERIERLEEEKKNIADDIKEFYSAAKGEGFDPKIMRQVVRLRKIESSERQEQEALLHLYMHALGLE